MKPENLLRRLPTSHKLTTGCEILDVCLRGGIPCDSLTEIVAESGCGKTQLCLQLSLCAQLPLSLGGLDGSSLYLHSEFPFPFRRLHQLSRLFHQSNPSIYANHNDNPCDHVFVQNVHSVDHLFDIMLRIDGFVGNSKNRFPLKLIVLDSVAALFRSEFDNTPSDLKKRSSLFFKISGKLKQLANKFGLAVVITNQVTDLVETSDGLSGLRIGNLRYLCSSGRRVVPALGLAWANCVNSRFFISRSDDTICKERSENDESGSSSVSTRAQRRLDILFSPYLPATSCEFMITREGICAVQALCYVTRPVYKNRPMVMVIYVRRTSLIHEKRSIGIVPSMSTPAHVAGRGSITHVIFDMDGLLLDTEKFYTEVQEIILARFNKKFDWSLKAKMMGRKAIEAARIFVEESGISGSLSAEDFLLERESMLQDLFPTSELMPGASRLIKHLHAKNIPICIATGTHTRHFDLKTQRHRELFSLMHHIVCGDDPEVKQGKPAPDGFLTAARRFKDGPVDPQKVLVFEDAPSGVLAAKNAGMNVVMVPDPRLDVSHQDVADQIITSLLDFKPEEWGLLPFEDSNETIYQASSR